MRRWAAIGAAVVLALLGTFLLISYVQGAEDRAREGQELAEILIVDEAVERGTLADELADSVRRIEIPVEALAEDAITDLEDLSGLIATVDLVPGEQLLSSRFKTPAELASEARVEVPPEFLQLSITLSPQRVVGGRLLPGDRVAVIASFEPFNLATFEPTEDEEPDPDAIVVVTDDEGAVTSVGLQSPNATQIIIHKVLVTGVQVEEAPRETTDGVASTVEFAPTGNLVITLAATAEDIERIVFTAEFGSIWLALEDAEAPEPETEIRTRENIYR
jgi:pilus assembly protein CpaB